MCYIETIYIYIYVEIYAIDIYSERLRGMVPGSLENSGE